MTAFPPSGWKEIRVETNWDIPPETHWAMLQKPVPFWREPGVWCLATLVVLLIILVLK